MAGVVVPGTKKLIPAFTDVALFYGAAVVICPEAPILLHPRAHHDFGAQVHLASTDELPWAARLSAALVALRAISLPLRT
ncbi:MAG: hypothetical protein ABR529_04690 [Actinomycetota bacterium]